MKVQNAGIWGGFLLLIFASILFTESLGLQYYTPTGPGPGFFPIWINGTLIILSIVYIGLSLKKEKILFKDIFPKGKDLINMLSVLGSIVIFMLIIEVAGFVTASTVLLFLVLFRLYKWYLALGVSVGTSILLLVIFQYVMEVPLPVNMFGW